MIGFEPKNEIAILGDGTMALGLNAMNSGICLVAQSLKQERDAASGRIV